eukprot:11895941-Alexandrium_andersonii.AAC.1
MVSDRFGCVQGSSGDVRRLPASSELLGIIQGRRAQNGFRIVQSVSDGVRQVQSSSDERVQKPSEELRRVPSWEAIARAVVSGGPAHILMSLAGSRPTLKSYSRGATDSIIERVILQICVHSSYSCDCPPMHEPAARSCPLQGPSFCLRAPPGAP